MKPTKSMITVAMRKMRFICLAPLLLPGSTGLVVPAGLALDYSVLTNSVEAARAARYEAFRDFRIKGVCGTARLDLATAYGADNLQRKFGGVWQERSCELIHTVPQSTGIRRSVKHSLAHEASGAHRNSQDLALGLFPSNRQGDR